MISELNQHNDEADIELYPNPVKNGVVYLRGGSPEQTDVIVYRLDGQVAHHSTYSGESISIDISELTLVII